MNARCASTVKDPMYHFHLGEMDRSSTACQL